MVVREEIFDETAVALKTLGHPTRLAILSLLARTKPPGLSVKQVQQKLQAAQPETSKHLITMRNQDILKIEKKAGFSFYSINSEITYLDALIKYLARLTK